MERKNIQDEKWQAENFKTLGFEIYDYIHLLSAVTMVVLLIVFWKSLDNATAQVSLFKEIVFFFMSGLLIFFVAFIAENEDAKMERMIYNFCWLIASLALFMPAMFDLILFFIEGLDPAEHLSVFAMDLASMICPILALSLFVLAVLRLNQVKFWNKLMLAAVTFFLLATLFDIVQMTIELIAGGFSIFVLIELITAMAPIAPAAFGYHDFYLLHNYLKKEK